MNVSDETTAAFGAIMESSMFRRDGPEIDLCAALIRLVEAIDEEPEDSDWIYLGEGCECSADSLLVGAYWALTEWHRGQDSPEYAAQCSIGTIFSPGMTSGPEPESSEVDAYDAVGAYFEAKSKARVPTE